MRRITFVEGEYYHLYNRGVDKRVVFTESSEYRRFIAYLYLLNTQKNIRPADLLDEHTGNAIFSVERGDPLVAVGAYCLMPNHIHLFATPLVKGGISKYMQRVQTAYTMFFNEKHRRSGALFQGTFKAEHADHDKYVKYLFSYIHLNPAKLANPSWKQCGRADFKALRTFIREYPYSSIGEYLSKKHIITNPTKFPNYFLQAHEVDDHIDFWLSTQQ
jgi:putative transposase